EPGLERRTLPDRLEEALPPPGPHEDRRRGECDTREEKPWIGAADLGEDRTEVEATEREGEESRAEQDADDRFPVEERVSLLRPTHEATCRSMARIPARASRAW